MSKPTTVPEVVEDAVVRRTSDGQPDERPAAVAPTQMRRPWRSTARTIFQALVGLCVLAPILVKAAGLDAEKLPWLGTVLVVAAGVTRVMALPGVEAWLRRFLPFLAAAPKPGA